MDHIVSPSSSYDFVNVASLSRQTRLVQAVTDTSMHKMCR